jgi:hypothetical protein
MIAVFVAPLFAFPSSCEFLFARPHQRVAFDTNLCVIIAHCTFTDLIDNGFGGALMLRDPVHTTSIQDCRFTRCKNHRGTESAPTGYGGAASIDAEDVEVLWSCGYQCVAGWYGKFMHFGGNRMSNGQRTLNQTTVHKCAPSDDLGLQQVNEQEAPRMGGAISADCLPIRVENTNFTSCGAHHGSAIRSFRTATLTAIRLIVTKGNNATGIDVGSSNAVIHYARCYGNHYDQGVVAVDGCFIELKYCEFYDNQRDLELLPNYWGGFTITGCRFSGAPPSAGAPYTWGETNFWQQTPSDATFDGAIKPPCVARPLTSFFVPSTFVCSAPPVASLALGDSLAFPPASGRFAASLDRAQSRQLTSSQALLFSPAFRETAADIASAGRAGPRCSKIPRSGLA